MRAPTRLLVTAALALLVAAPASAGNLTGVWKGKFSCKAQNAQGQLKMSSRGVTAPDPGVSTLEITHPNGAGTPALQVRIDGVLFAGFVLGVGPAVGGVGAFIGCDPGDLRSFKWKATPGVAKAKISWRGMLVSNDAMVGSCRGSWTRVSLAEPAVPPESCR